MGASLLALAKSIYHCLCWSLLELKGLYALARMRLLTSELGSANKQPRARFHVRNRPSAGLVRVVEGSRVKVMLNFIVSTETFIFSDLTH